MKVLSEESLNYEAIYNSLNPQVEEVYEEFTCLEEYERKLHDGVSIIKEHGADDFLGLFLVHRHFESKDGKLFIERTITPEKGDLKLLVTTPMGEETAPRRIAGHRFVLVDGQFYPIEFSTDRSVISHHKVFQENGALLEELSTFLTENKLEKFLGVGIFPRKIAGNSKNEVYVEDSDLRRLASIIRVIEREEMPDREFVVPTLWTWSAQDNGCCTTNSICVAFCSAHGTSNGFCGHKQASTGHVGCV